MQLFLLGLPRVRVYRGCVLIDAARAGGSLGAYQGWMYIETRGRREVVPVVLLLVSQGVALSGGLTPYRPTSLEVLLRLCAHLVILLDLHIQARRECPELLL